MKVWVKHPRNGEYVSGKKRNLLARKYEPKWLYLVDRKES